MTRKSFFYFNSCYEENEDVAPYVDRYVLRAQQASRLILLRALWGDRGGVVVKVLCYKSEGRWFDPGWCHWNFSMT